VLRERWAGLCAYYDPVKDCPHCPHCVCAASKDAEPHPGYGDDPDWWLVCPAKELDKPEHQWVYRLLHLYRHWAKGQLGLWVPHPTESLGRLLMIADSAITELQNWRIEKSLPKGKT